MVDLFNRLGNVKFAENAEGNSMIPDESVIEFIAYLMEVDKDLLGKVLTSRVIETQRGGRRGQYPLKPLTHLINRLGLMGGFDTANKQVPSMTFR